MRNSDKMEVISNEPRIIKRRRVTKNTTSKPKLNVIECVREFKLPQAYPSKLPSPGKVTVDRVTVPTSPQAISAMITKEVGNKLKVSTTLQKLKLRSLDGKDIGEYNVQVLPQNHEKITCKAFNKKESVKNLNGLSKNVHSVTNTERKEDPGRVITKLKGGVIREVNDPLMETVSPNMIFHRKPPVINLEAQTSDKTGPTHGVLIPISPSMLTNSNSFSDQQVSIVENGQNSKIFVVKNGDNWQMIEFNGNQQKLVRSLNSSSSSPPPITVQTGNSNGITVKPINLDINCMKGLKPIKLGKKMPSGQKLKIVDGQRKRSSSTEPEISNKRRLPPDFAGPYPPLSIDENQFMSILQDASTSAIKIEEYNENLDDDTIVVLPAQDRITRVQEHNNDNSIRNNFIISQQSFGLKNSQGTVNLIRRGKKDLGTINRLECDNTNSIQPTDIIETKVIPNTRPSIGNNEKKSAEQDMFSQLSIVGQALRTIQDKDLRAKALKALADCGIGMERLVPTKPPLDKTAISDSGTQTQVFGLLDATDFIRVTEDSETVFRIKEKEKVCQKKAPEKQKSSTVLKSFNEDLDSMITKFSSNALQINKVNQILDVNPMVEKVHNLLKTDFANAKKFDGNGKLNIHEAVLSNQVRAVRKQLMILRKSQLDVDAPTEDGQTALELAIQYQSKTEIVQLLLQAGANPTSSKQVHDSALTIACKQETPLITLLIEYVKSAADLNNIDSTGFAAIHYCTQNGNSDAVLKLVNAGADINLRDHRSGRTPVFHAFENEHFEMTRILLKHGAKPGIQNYSGHNIFTLFDENKHFVLRDLLSKSARTN